MCDTQVIRHDGSTFFAKNSDREADEPQYIRYYPAVAGDDSTSLQTTYIRVEQVPDRHAVILSQPSWIWGAEMGVNEHGLVIGNEAVFTRLVDKSGTALLGMDMLRLALERCRTAAAAIECIGGLLRRYGQAGPGGYRDKNSRYDNSFVIADPDAAWVMETAGRHWVARRVNRLDAISNALSIGDDFDLHSEGLHEYARSQKRLAGGDKLDFARAFDTRFMRIMGRAAQRRACSLLSLSVLESPDLRSMAANLREHATGGDDFSRHGNADVCMHAGGLLRPSQTTGSMLVRLRPGMAPEIVVTGTSAPCLSLFQPVSFKPRGEGSYLFQGEATAALPALWQQFESVHQRALRDPEFCRRLRASRDALEPHMFDSSIDISQRGVKAAQWHRHWLDQARSGDPGYRWYSSYDRFWRSKRTIFG